MSTNPKNTKRRQTTMRIIASLLSPLSPAKPKIKKKKVAMASIVIINNKKGRRWGKSGDKSAQKRQKYGTATNNNKYCA